MINTNWFLFTLAIILISVIGSAGFLSKPGNVIRTKKYIIGLTIFVVVSIFSNFILYFVEPFEYWAFHFFMLLCEYLNGQVVLFITVLILLCLSVPMLLMPNYFDKNYIAKLLLVPFFMSFLIYNLSALDRVKKYKDYLALKTSFSELYSFCKRYQDGVGCKKFEFYNEILDDKLSSLNNEEYLKLKNNAFEYFRDIEAQKEQEKIKKEAQAKKAEEEKRQEILGSLEI